MLVEVSIGELIDKISILKIKQEKICDEKKLKHINHELKMLYPLMEKTKLTFNSPEFRQLLTINEKLWELENIVRFKEKKQEFGAEFIHVARQIYIGNDERATLKKRINIKYGSEIIEEKEYSDC